MSSRGVATPLRFAIKFLAGFALLMGAFEASRGSAFERFLVEDLILRPAIYLINAITPGEHVQLVGRTISSAGANLHVTRGCEGIEMFILLGAAIIAFPASWRSRVQGLVFGALLAYCLSILRLMALHYTLRYTPGTWEALHGLVLPMAPIILIAYYFLRWSASVPETTAATFKAHEA